MTKLTSDTDSFLECGNCISWLQLQDNMGMCVDGTSDHYKHVIMKDHPACEKYLPES